MEDFIHETITDSLGFSLSGQRYSKLHSTLSGKTKAYKRLFGSKREEAVGSWRKLHVEDHINCLFRAFFTEGAKNESQRGTQYYFVLCFSARSMKCNIGRLHQKFAELDLL